MEMYYDATQVLSGLVLEQSKSPEKLLTLMQKKASHELVTAARGNGDQLDLDSLMIRITVTAKTVPSVMSMEEEAQADECACGDDCPCQES